MGLARSTFYDVSPVPLQPDELLARIGAICDEFECYGYRRIGAALLHQGVVVNSKKLRRLMRQHDLQPKRRRRYVITTDSDHAGPIFPNLAKDVVPERPNQLWVADLTYVAIPASFVYLAAILDAWSRKVVGYAISRLVVTYGQRKEFSTELAVLNAHPYVFDEQRETKQNLAVAYNNRCYA